MFQKVKAKRDAKHLKFIRTLICVVCWNNPCDASHIRIGGGGGIGLKPGDDRTVPLCHNCHATQHRIGERSFWGDVGRAIGLALSLYDNSGNREACLKLIMDFRK